MKRKTRVLEENDIVPFKAMTKEYGRAEFTFCPVYKRGKLKEIHISPQQQPDAKENFVIHNTYSDSFQITSFDYKEPPRPWLYMWCAEHKCPAFRVYVPDDVKAFQVHKLTTMEIRFIK